jgi:hypothetical protein
MAQIHEKEYVLVNPTTQAIVAPFSGASRTPSLAGARIGIIDDSKRNADVLLEELVQVLRDRYEISDVRWHRKPSASRPADPTAIRDLAEQCDAVVVGVGD